MLIYKFIPFCLELCLSRDPCSPLGSYTDVYWTPAAKLQHRSLATLSKRSSDSWNTMARCCGIFSSFLDSAWMLSRLLSLRLRWSKLLLVAMTSACRRWRSHSNKCTVSSIAFNTTAERLILVQAWPLPTVHTDWGRALANRKHG